MFGLTIIRTGVLREMEHLFKKHCEERDSFKKQCEFLSQLTEKKAAEYVENKKAANLHQISYLNVNRTRPTRGMVGGAGSIGSAGGGLANIHSIHGWEESNV